ncbi:hypothetical protein ACSQ67_015168 [Phaseolus vulgaris]
MVVGECSRRVRSGSLQNQNGVLSLLHLHPSFARFTTQQGNSSPFHAGTKFLFSLCIFTLNEMSLLLITYYQGVHRHQLNFALDTLLCKATIPAGFSFQPLA